MSMLDEETTLCVRANNKCKQRKKCWRYMAPRTEQFWEGDYWDLFGQFCTYHQDMSHERYY